MLSGGPPAVTPIFRPNDAYNATICGKYDLLLNVGRRFQVLKIVAVSMVSVITLIVVVSLNLKKITESSANSLRMKDAIEKSTEMADLIHNLQIERGRVVLYLSSGRTDSARNRLSEDQSITDATIRRITKWPDNDIILSTRSVFEHNLMQHRRTLTQQSTVRDQIDFYSAVIAAMMNQLFEVAKAVSQANIINMFTAFRNFLISKEKTGLERALGGVFFSLGYFNNTRDLLWFAEQNTIGREYLNSSLTLMPDLKNFYDQALQSKNNSLLPLLQQKRQIIFNNIKQNGSEAAANTWFDLMSEYISVLLTVQNLASKHISDELFTIVENSERALILQSILLVLVIAGTPVMCFAVGRLTSSIQSYARRLSLKTKQLDEEKDRADALLYQMFPKSVAEQLKRGEIVRAEHFESVTVYFSDIVNFTSICSSVTPMEVTLMLNIVYGIFDELTERHDVYKVETIGDAYMVVSGVPRQNGDKHVVHICKLAIDIVGAIGSLIIDFIPGERISIRTGIHTGSCVAGVVGTRMPRYCLFGDTVNIASRMESTGLPQLIQISEDTNEILKRFGGFCTEFRGYTEIKGKGNMKTFWLQLKNISF